MSIMRQADQYAAFGPPQFSRQAREERPDLPSTERVGEFLGGPRVGTGQLNPRHRVAVGTDHMDPDDHAYNTEDISVFGPGEDRHWDPNTGYQPSPRDEQRAEAVADDDDSGYNWGPTPHFDPGAEPGPHPDFHGDAPHPFGTPVYQPHPGDPERLGFKLAGGEGPMPAEIAEASGNSHLLDNEGTLWHQHPQHGWRYVTTDQDGGSSWGYDARSRLPQEYEPYSVPHPAVADLARHVRDDQPGSRLGFNRAHLAQEDGQAFNPMLYYPGQYLDERSELLGGDDVPARWPTAASSTERLAHGYFPSNRVGLPYKDTIIPGTVTHLDGMNVGVRWDDGQHSSEDPVDIHPL